VCNPNDGTDHFWSMPDRFGADADRLASQFNDLISGKKWLYVFINMKYKDSTMAEDIIGVTERCAYFPGNFDVWHECGRRRSFLNVWIPRRFISDELTKCAYVWRRHEGFTCLIIAGNIPRPTHYESSLLNLSPIARFLTNEAFEIQVCNPGRQRRSARSISARTELSPMR
jgi:hypothetical protein